MTEPVVSALRARVDSRNLAKGLKKTLSLDLESAGLCHTTWGPASEAPEWTRRPKRRPGANSSRGPLEISAARDVLYRTSLKAPTHRTENPAMQLGTMTHGRRGRLGRLARALLLLALTLGGCRGAAGEPPSVAAAPPPVQPARAGLGSEAGPDSEAVPRPQAQAAPTAEAASAGLGALASPDALAAAIERHHSDQWYGVYMLGKKIGHARVWMRPSGEGEPGAYATGTELEMTVRGLLGEARMDMSEARFYAAEAPHSLIETRMRSEASGVVDERVGRNTPEGLVVTRTTAGRAVAPRTIARSQESLASLFVTMPTDAASLRPGQSARAPWFNWEAEKDDFVSVTVASVRPGTHAGVDTTLATLDVKYEKMGLSATSLVAGAGVVVETALGQGLVLKLEEKDVARSDVVGLDVMGSGVPVAKKLGRPHDIIELTLKVKTPGDYALPSAANQEVTPLEDGWSRVVLRSSPGAPVTTDERAAALESDATMDADSPSIQAKAKELTEGAADDADKARRLGAWVFQTLDKQLATHLPTASTVLDKKLGDCTEHTWLFVALARAAGLPARPVYGVGYTGDGHASFGYHAWAEVAIDGHWVAVDPTWGEPVADATHLRLASELSDVAAIIGGLEIQVEGEPRRR